MSFESQFEKSLQLDKQQKNNYSRYGVRFINCPLSPNTYSSLITACSKMNIKVYFLSDSIASQSSMITKSAVLNFVINHIKENKSDLMFLGLSEIIRLFSKEDYESIVRTLIEFQNSPISDRRILFPMFSSYVKLAEIVRLYTEKNYYPILNIDNNESYYADIDLYFVQEDTSFKNVLYLNTLREYYELIKHIRKNCYKIICKSEKAIRYLSANSIISDDTFRVSYFKDSKSICNFYLLDFNLNNNYYFDDSIYELLNKQISLMSDYSSGLSIKNIVEKRMNLASHINLFEMILNERDDFRYFVIMYYLNYHNDDTSKFIEFILSKSCKYDKETIIYTVFESLKYIDLPYDKQIIFSIRKEYIELLLKDGYVSYVNEQFEDKYNDIIKESYLFLFKHQFFVEDVEFEELDFKEFLSSKDCQIVKKLFNEELRFRLSDKSLFERKLMIWLYKNQIIDNDDIKELYPDLYGYLFYSIENYVQDDKLINYFAEYRKSKVYGVGTPAFVKIKDEYLQEALADSYEAFNNWSMNIKNRTVKDVSRIEAYDGVGFEYVPYMIYLLTKNSKISVLSSEPAKCKLPSITKINKEELESYKKFDSLIPDYDSYVIHGDFYNSVDNVEKSLRIIKNMVSNTIKKMKAGETISITADHGSTVQHKFITTAKKYNFSNSEHDGRCCDITNLGFDDNHSKDYIIYKDYASKKEWLLATSNSSLFNTPRYEAHGGATIEEVCVPDIIVSYDKNIEYKLVFFKNTINGIDRTVSFSVNPMPYGKVYVYDEMGNKLDLLLVNGAYQAELKIAKTQTITIKIMSYEFKEIITNNSMNDNGDDFF